MTKLGQLCALSLATLLAACSGAPTPTAEAPTAAAPTTAAGPTPAATSAASPSATGAATPTPAATTPADTPAPVDTASPAAPTDAPATPVPSANGPCPTGTGPTEHSSGSVSAPETWTAAQSPHVIAFDLTVNAELTLEPCVEVRLAAGRTISISATGSIVANGDAERHITIAADQPGETWNYIRAVGGGSLRLAYVDISGGGDPGNSLLYNTGTLYLQGADGIQPTQPTLFADHLTITDSASNGIYMRDGAGFAPGSTDLVVSGAAGWPVAIWGRAAGTLPEGTYTGNATDVITLLDADGGGSFLESTTLRNLGVQYLVGGEQSTGGLRVTAPVGATETSVLTIEAGVTLMFRPSGIMEVEHFTGPSPALGAVVAQGTPEQPVVFTSAAETPAPGDWYGLRYGLIPSPLNDLTGVRIEYAGFGSPGPTAGCRANTQAHTTGAALSIYGKPADRFLTDSTIFASAGNGVARGWGTGKRINFVETNTFDQVAGCNQT